MERWSWKVGWQSRRWLNKRDNVVEQLLAFFISDLFFTFFFNFSVSLSSPTFLVSFPNKISFVHSEIIFRPIRVYYFDDPFICIRKFESDAEIFFSIAKQRSVRERFIGYARGPCPRTRAPQTVDGQGNNRRNTYSTLKGYPPSAYRRRVDTIALYLVCGNLFYFPLEAINRLISSGMIDHVAEKSV